MDYLLEYKGFRASAGHLLNNLIEDKDFTDVTLACDENQQVAAHKVVLSSSSTVFKNILLNNPHKHPIIYLTDIKHNELRLILQFIYLGKTKVLRDDLDKFLVAANKLKISGLSDLNQDKSSLASLNPNTEQKSNLASLNIPTTVPPTHKPPTTPKPPRNPLEETSDPLKNPSNKSTPGPETITQTVTNFKKEINEEQSNVDEIGKNDDSNDTAHSENPLNIPKSKDILAVFEGILADNGEEQRTVDTSTLEETAENGTERPIDDPVKNSTKEHDLFEAISSNIKKQLEDKRKFPCEMCDYVATQKCNLNAHQKRKHGMDQTPRKNTNGSLEPTPFKKPVLPGNTETTPWKTPNKRGAGNVETQTWKKNSEEGQETPSKRRNSVPADGFKCDNCDYKAASKQTLKIHNEAKHEGKKYECKHCSYKSSYRSGLYIHEKKSHSES